MSEQAYLDLLRDIMENGVDRPDRTGVGTRSVFGKQLRWNLSDGFPLLTTKKMELKSVLSELIWFIEGSGDERRLAEIRYGKPRAELAGKRTIWTDNAEAPYWKDKARFEGDLGRPYGVQLRQWTNQYGEVIDQLQILVNGLKNDPYSRRHCLLWWNPGELSKMALPACHQLANFVVMDNKLNCLFTMRSNDFCLGNPYNGVSYAILTHMLAQVCGFEVGEVVFSGVDIHIYLNHVEGAKEQLTRVPRPLPKLRMDTTITRMEDFKMEHFSVDGYDPYPSISFEMAV
jgi:thymidylate synthase